MRLFLCLAAVLTGCSYWTEASHESVSPSSTMPPPSPLVLSGPEAAAPGDTIELSVAVPSSAPATVRMGYNVFFPSTTGGLGNGRCPPPLNGSCLDIQGDIDLLGSATTQFGTATLTYTIPATFAEPALYVQGVIISPQGNAYLSDPLEITMGICGDSVTDPNEDCDDGSGICHTLTSFHRGCYMDAGHNGRCVYGNGSAPADRFVFEGGPFQDLQGNGFAACALGWWGELQCQGEVSLAPGPALPASTLGVEAFDMGPNNACAITDSGATLTCWGRNDYGQVTNVPSGGGNFYDWRDVSMSGLTVCGVAGVSSVSRFDALGAPSQVLCWGFQQTQNVDVSTLPSERFDHIDLEQFVNTVRGCVETEDHEVYCFQSGGFDQDLTPPPIALDMFEGGPQVGSGYACAIDCNSQLVCWGEMDATSRAIVDAYQGHQFTQLGPNARCAVARDSFPGTLTVPAHEPGELVCWADTYGDDLADAFCPQNPAVPETSLDGDCDATPTAADCDDSDPFLGAQANDQDCDGILAGDDCDDDDQSVAAESVGHCLACPDDYSPNYTTSGAYQPLFSPFPGNTVDIAGAELCLETPRDFFALSLGVGSPVHVEVSWTDPDAVLAVTAYERTTSPFGLQSWESIGTATCTDSLCDITYTPSTSSVALGIELTTPSATDSDGDGSFDSVPYLITWGDP